MKFPRMSHYASAPPPEGRRRSALRRWLLGGAATLMLSTAVAAVALPNASAAPTLLSQGKPATASSTENAGTPAADAVDGNTGTRWSSAFSDPQWLQVDLGATATISQVVLNWEAAYATAFQIQTSADGTTWTTIYSTTTGTGGIQTLERHRHRPLRPDVRHRARHRATATRCGSSRSSATLGGPTGQLRHRPTPRWASPATASSTENAGTPAVGRRRRQHRHPLVQRRSATRSGSRSTSARTPADLPGRRCNWEAAYAQGVPDPGLRPTAPPGPRSTPPPPAPAASRRSTSPAPAATSGCTAPRAATGYGYSLWEFEPSTAAAPPTEPAGADPPVGRRRTSART